MDDVIADDVTIEVHEMRATKCALCAFISRELSQKLLKRLFAGPAGSRYSFI